MNWEVLRGTKTAGFYFESLWKDSIEDIKHKAQVLQFENTIKRTKHHLLTKYDDLEAKNNIPNRFADKKCLPRQKCD